MSVSGRCDSEDAIRLDVMSCRPVNICCFV